MLLLNRSDRTEDVTVTVTAWSAEARAPGQNPINFVQPKAFTFY
jgi:hypothetical protein